MDFSMRSIGETMLKPTDIEQSDFATDIKSTTPEVVDTYIDDAFYGTTSAYGAKQAFDVKYQDAKNAKITQDEYKNSDFYHPENPYYDGMTQQGAEILYKNKTEAEKRAYIQNKGTTTQNVLGFAAGLGAGIFEPINLGVGIATAGLGTVATKTLPALSMLKKTVSPIKYAIGSNVVEGAVSTAMQAPLSVASGNVLNDEYTATDAFSDFAIGTAIGAGFDVGAKILKNRSDIKIGKSLNEVKTMSEKYGLDFETMYAIMGNESGFNPKAKNKDTGAFGSFQFTPETAKDYGVNKYSTADEYMDAVGRYTKDNKDYVESKIGRPINATEAYLAHNFGRGGAVGILNGDVNERFVDMAKREGIYNRKDGTSFADLVMTQNGLSKDATLGEVIKSREDKMNYHVNKLAERVIPTSIFNNTKAHIKMDNAIEQAVNGFAVDNTNIQIASVNNFLNETQKTLDDLLADHKQSIDDLNSEFQNFDFEKNVSDFNVSPLLKIKKPILNRLKSNVKLGSPLAKELENLGINYKSYPSFYSKKGKITDIDSLIGNEYFDDLISIHNENNKFDAGKNKIDNNLLNNNPNELYNLIQDEMLGKNKFIDPKDINNVTDYSPKTIQSIKSNNEKKIALKKAIYKKNLQNNKPFIDFEFAYRQKIQDLNDAKYFYQSSSFEFLSNMHRGKMSKDGLKDKIKSLHDAHFDIEARIKSLKDWVLNENKNFNNLLIENQERASKKLNDYLFDVPLIEQTQALSKEIADTVDSINNESRDALIRDIDNYAKNNELDDDMMQAYNSINNITKQDYEAIYKEAETCLIQFGD